MVEANRVFEGRKEFGIVTPNGLCCPEGIITILEKPEQWRRVRKNGRKTAEAYSWRKTALKHEEFYRAALKHLD